MLTRNNLVSIIVVVVILVVGGAMSMTAAPQKAMPKETPNKLAIGEAEVKQLILLMDTDKNGKISRKEYMDFMAAEFDRLDKDKSGELDPKELAQSSIRVSHSAPVGK